MTQIRGGAIFYTLLDRGPPLVKPSLTFASDILSILDIHLLNG